MFVPIKGMRIVRAVLSVLTLLAVCTTSVSANHLDSHPRSSARSATPYLSTYLAIGLGFGGDEVGRFTDNFGYTDSIHSGGGLLLEGGLNLSVDPLTNLRFSGGYQLDGTRRGNGSSRFDRLRFDLVMLRNVGVHEFGAGVTAHTSVGYQCDISSICSGDVEFNHAIGYTLEYALNLGGLGFSDTGQGLRLGVRYTGIDYTPRLVDAEVLNGNSVTGFIAVVF